MSYFCDVCLIDSKKKSKHSHLRSRSHKEFGKYKHILLSFKNIDIKDVDETLYLYMKNYNKKYTQYLLKTRFKLVFNNQDCKYLMTVMINNTTSISLSNYLRDVISNLKEEEGYDFSHIAEMNNITLAHKCDMTYDFYLKHIMSAFEWKFNAMINKDKNLINKFPRKRRHPINTKFSCYRNNIIWKTFSCFSLL